MGDRLEFKKDVAVVVNGQASFNGPLSEPPPLAPPVYVDEKEFFKWTGIDASAPARVALNRLLHEDVTSRAIRAVWKDELVFVDDREMPRFTIKTYHLVPTLTIGLYVCFLLCSALLIVGKGFASGPTLLMIGFMWVVLVWLSVYITATEVRPYYISKRITPIVDRVNLELPAILNLWRRGL